MKKPGKTIQIQKKRTWDAVRFYIYQRDNYICYTCGSCTIFTRPEAGHMLGVGAYPSIRYNELNIHVQCTICNQDLGGNIKIYKAKFIAEHGEKVFEELRREGSQVKKFTLLELFEIELEYINKRKELLC